jgi:dipeptidyl aminopeptidase/acylaminoacyl peptidase
MLLATHRIVPLALGLALAMAATAQAAAPGDTLTPQDVARLRVVSKAEISPDGKRVAFVRSVPRAPGVDEDGSSWSELWVMDLEDGRERPFITGKVDVGPIEWTRDGQSIAFLAKRGDDKFTSLYVIPADGGEAKRELSMESSLSAFSYSPEGRRVAVLAKDPEDPAVKKRKDQGFKQEIYEEDDLPTRVWVAELGEGKPKPRALPIEGSMHQLAWSPVDERILVTMSPAAPPWRNLSSWPRRVRSF